MIRDNIRELLHRDPFVPFRLLVTSGKIYEVVSPDSAMVPSPMPHEQAGLSLIRAVLIDLSRRWRGLKITPGDLEKLNRLRAEVAPLAASA